MITRPGTTSTRLSSLHFCQTEPSTMRRFVLLVFFLLHVQKSFQAEPSADSKNLRALAITIANLKESLIDETDVTLLELNKYYSTESGFPTSLDQQTAFINAIGAWIPTPNQKPTGMQFDLSEFVPVDKMENGPMKFLAELAKAPTDEILNQFLSACVTFESSAYTNLKSKWDTEIQSIKQSPAAPDDYDRKNFLQNKKKQILDWIVNHVIVSFCKSESLISAKDWDDLIEHSIKVEKLFLQNWFKALETDVQRVMSEENNDIGALKKNLDEKFYWYRFRINFDDNDRILYRGKEIKYNRTVDGTTTEVIDPAIKRIKLSTGKTVVVRWYLLDLDYLNTLKLPARPVTVSTTLTQGSIVSATDTWAKTASFINILSAIGEVTHDHVGSESKKATMAVKRLLRLMGEVGKYLGPIASAIASYVSFFAEEGTTNIVNEIRAGFSEMHNRFNQLEQKITELGAGITAEFGFKIAYKSYEDNIQGKKNNLISAENKTLERPNDSGRSEALREMCTPSGADPITPFDLLRKMHDMFFQDAEPITKLLKEWAYYDRLKLQKYILIFARDATTLSVWIPKCNGYIAPFEILTLKDEVSTSRRWLSQIRFKLLELLHEQEYEWQDRMEKEVKSLSWSGSAAEIALAIEAKLTNNFNWNDYHIYVANLGKQDGEQIIERWDWFINRDYARVINKDPYIAYISWTMKDQEPEEQSGESGVVSTLTNYDNCNNGRFVVSPPKSEKVQSQFVTQGLWYRCHFKCSYFFEWQALRGGEKTLIYNSWSTCQTIKPGSPGGWRLLGSPDLTTTKFVRDIANTGRGY